MERNFFRRIEVCFPIERKQHRDRIVEDLESYLADNEQAWVLKPDGSYVRAGCIDAMPVSAQRVLLQRYSDNTVS
jgi:polyphosphate kinase